MVYNDSFWDKFRKIIRETVQEIMREFISKPLTNDKDYRKETVKKLKAYPVLKNNIKEFEKDIQDIQKEEFGSSPAVHIAQAWWGAELTIDEIRHAECLKIQKKIDRDERVIDEVNRALKEIEDNCYAPIIPLYFFENRKVQEIAEILHCDVKTIYANKKKLIDILILKFYGGDAI